MAEINFDELRLKDVDDMSDEEKAYLVEHKAELSDEELAAFGSFINPAPADDTGEEGEEGADNGGETAEQKAQREADEAAAAAGKPKPPVFKTVEESEKWLEKKKEEWKAEEARQAEEAIAAKKRELEQGQPIEFFGAGYKPKDYNAFANDLFKGIVTHLGKQTEFINGIRTALGELTSAERKQIDSINEDFDKELQTMASEGLVPDPTTKEGKELDKQLTSIGARMGLGSMRDAYKAMQDLRKEMGLEPYKPGTPAATPGTKTTPMTTQKQKASMVSHGGMGQPGAAKKSYQQDVHGKTMDQIMEEADKDLQQ